MKRHYRQSRYEQGGLFCALGVFLIDDQRTAVADVWYPGGAKNGCHQPFTVAESFESLDEIDIRTDIERRYPGIEYRAMPII